MKIVPFTSLLVLSVLWAGSLCGQSSLQGKVTDAETGDPILLGNVVLMKKGVFIIGTETDFDGFYRIDSLAPGIYDVEVTYVGYATKQVAHVEIKAAHTNQLDIQMTEGVALDEVVVTAYKAPVVEKSMSSAVRITSGKRSRKHRKDRRAAKKFNTESYLHLEENTFRSPRNEPLSTFSIDVDRASYANVRRFIQREVLPPVDAVRIEELINYFDYDYALPRGKHPFAVHTELGPCPWNPAHQLLHIGLQGKEYESDMLPPSNLVFLLDVSGSMDTDNKLPLVKHSIELLVKQLRPRDRVAMVVYAGAAGLVLPSTSASEKATILQALDRLEAGGSTAGGAGIELAYQVAKEHFLPEGNNRVILATDGDFNVGTSGVGPLTRLIERKRKHGIYLTVLGFGMGNYKDSYLEALADHGNGNYAYIDSEKEAIKVFSEELTGTLFTIAKDVKLQLEFNPRAVEAYRLIGYENRLLDEEDFNDDAKDAGELGAGHTVTALYEIIPAGVKTNLSGQVDPLRYQRLLGLTHEKDELLSLKLRYKQPDKRKSILLENRVMNQNAEQLSESFHFSAALAAWGMKLRASEYQGTLSWKQLLSLAEEGIGADRFGYRKECFELMRASEQLIATRESLGLDARSINQD